MIYIRLSGRFGNYLFQIATGASLAKKFDTEFKVVVAPDAEAISIVSRESMWNYVSSFKENIFREIEFVHEVPTDVPLYSWRDFPYKPIPYEGTDLLVDGYFQSYKYVDSNLMRQLYAVPKEISDKLKQKYGEVLKQSFTCIHVRRGDYLKLPHRFSICSMAYFRKAIRQIGENTLFVIISDDLKWCKKHFKGQNYVFADKGNSMLEDFYLQSLATNNIISNSSFSWWGAWLNINPDKKVFYPTPWFGPHYSHYDTFDLCPDSWIPIPNQTPLRYQLKSVWIRLEMKVRHRLERK
ncbi:alpha-1,2-fucosyltransferase [Bacteroides oleiciplenus]|uniref:alpha-1,2-fucosyltransferase n=1 Tax=Bacteroides oleiciplenus TaxID=626931 RepID=UPI0026DD2B91|nr:alpha-1,2-fucosyltransferase [Bacteroides oleiciplenus]